jgi:hypothetical protein
MIIMKVRKHSAGVQGPALEQKRNASGGRLGRVPRPCKRAYGGAVSSDSACRRFL